jgi:murein DD-endopeptidase MepM/ murein hydrolase activator NlpD
VAAGVVTYAKERFGYGRTVEINHGNGYVTRYAHNDNLKVKAGDTVKRGDPIARIGSTGRSTGPHLHFEVLSQGRAVDPMSFVSLKEVQ